MSVLFSPKFQRTLAIIAFWLAIGAVIWGQLGPGEGESFLWDKLQHFLAYAVLASLATMALDAKGYWLWALMGLILFGAFMEVAQGILGRDMSKADELANILGVIAGGTAGWIYCRIRRAWLVETRAGE